MIPVPSYNSVRTFVLIALPIVAAVLFARFDVDGLVLRSWIDVLKISAMFPITPANLAWFFLVYALRWWWREPSLKTCAIMFAAVFCASPIGRTFLYYMGHGWPFH